MPSTEKALRLRDLVDLRILQPIWDSFYDLSGMATALLELDGEIITASGWTDICSHFHRVHPETRARCQESDTILPNSLREGEAFHVYRCKNGLLDAALPIIIEGVHYGNLFTGQFFLEEPDGAFFKAQAHAYGFDEEAYLAALEKVPRVSMTQVEKVLDFMRRISDMIVETGLAQQKNREIHERLRESHEALAESEARFRRLMDNAKDFIYRMSLPEGRYEYVSAASTKLTGYTPEELLKSPEIFQASLPPSSAAYFQEKWRDLLEGKMPPSYEYQIIHAKTGELRWLNQRNVLLKDEAGSPIAIEGIVSDVTQRKHMEERLRESEERFRIAFDSAEDCVLIWDADYNYLYANKSAIEHVGVSPAQVIGKNIRDGLGHMPDFMRLWMRRIDQVFETKSTLRVQDEQVILGKRYYTDSILSPILDAAGAVSSVCVVYRDLSELKETELKLREKEAFLDRLIEQSPFAICIFDAAGLLQRMNAAQKTALGPGWENFLGNYSILNDPLFADMGFLKPINAVYEKGESIHFTRDWQGEQLPPFWGAPKDALSVEATLFPIFDQNGRLTHALLQWVDVTEKRKAEKLLIDAQALLKAAITSLPGIFYLFDYTGRFLQWNQNFETISGYSATEIKTMQPTDFFFPEGRQAIQEAIEHAFSEGFVSVEADFRSKSGDVLPYLLTGAFFEQAGTPCLVGMGIDISERNRAEKERLSFERKLQHAQKLESLGVLAGGIAHDFNNILMAILGNADMAMDEISPLSPARCSIQEIEKAAKRAAELAKQMLAYSGKGMFVIEPILLHEFVEEMYHLLEVSISKKIALKPDFDLSAPYFDGDVTQIRQVIMNLITNASEAIGEEIGVISLATGVMDCDRQYLDSIDETLRLAQEAPLPEGPYVFLSVSDTGCGMDKGTMEKIFDPFFTTKFSGRGLGMAAVLGIVRGHKGGLKIESAPGKGSTFTVLFPANEVVMQNENSVPEKEPALPSWSGEGKVLFADDEEAVCLIGKRMLERIGFEVVIAKDGREALERFTQSPDEFDCVLLDLTMPHMDGEEAFLAMRAIRPGCIVLLCSGYNVEEAAGHFAGKGLAGFIQKPYSFSALRNKLQEVLR